MRFLYGRTSPKRLAAELEAVQSTMLSSYFIIVDLLIFSVFFTILLMKIFHSFLSALAFCLALYFFGIILFLILRKWFK
ncbi:hypothetical protein C0966_07970 [Bacillus methanolicus]|uniref:hypothetical protein n=1 Tax=Bacillus methanolicus TaxID=1471 RepID=UPI0023803425|nr:hypothetical protein [Bacillus methanolicus]MDE3839289.1 hypothetical protein [Bacillus methanolicus]